MKESTQTEFYEPIYINDNFENNKQYNLRRAQLIVADIPYNIGANAYGSNPKWYVGSDNKNGESELAGKAFFDRDGEFKISNLLHFGSRLLVKEKKQSAKEAKEKKNEPGCMFVFCAWQQVHELIEIAKRPEYGFKHSDLFVFRKKSSAQALKANMRCCGNFEVAVLLYKNRLPKFRNGRREDGSGIMEFTCRDWLNDKGVPKLHPTQKPIALLKDIIRLYTDAGDTVADLCAGSGTTLAAAYELGRRSYGFDVKREYKQAFDDVLMPYVRDRNRQTGLFETENGHDKGIA